MSLEKGDRKDRDLHEDLWFELSDESLCNWMMFVRPAQNHLEQNLVAYQYGHHVYYTTIKNVEPKQELKVPCCIPGAVSSRTFPQVEVLTYCLLSSCSLSLENAPQITKLLKVA